MIYRIIVAAIAAACLLSPAQARQHHRHGHHYAHRHHVNIAAQPACADIFCWFNPAPAETPRAVRTIARSAPSQVIGGRPAGCPHAFCGCGASLHLFGKIIPSLNLAANWLRFPRGAPAPGMAAVRSHHVFVLEQPINGDLWLAYDANSGGGRIRLHARSIAGYQIVNPHGGVS
jgi:hypothetical protein